MKGKFILIKAIIILLLKIELSAQQPTVNAGADISGCPLTNVRLNGSVTGVGVTYKWTPNTGLSRI